MRFKHVNDVVLLNQADFRLLAKLMCNYNEIDPACLKRFIAETLSQKGSLMLIELIEDNKIEKRANG